jgi:hypothetical protein
MTGRRGEPVATQVDDPACTATGIPLTKTRAEPTTHCPTLQKTPLGVSEQPVIV